MRWSHWSDGVYSGERRSAMSDRRREADYYEVAPSRGGWTVRITYGNDPHPGGNGYYGERFEGGTGRRYFVVLSDGSIGRDNDPNRPRIAQFATAADAKDFAARHAKWRLIHHEPPPELRQPDPGFGDWFGAWWDSLWA